MMIKNTNIKRLFAFFLIGILYCTNYALACSRVVYLGEDSVVITGRSMDWAEDIKTNLWIFPRGIQRNGLGGTNTIEWISKYGSVIASAYDIASSDGMNEKGLVGNMLYLAESDYGKNDGRPVMSLSIWMQYVLDNFATVSEAVKELKKEKFRIANPDLPNGKKSTIHLSISDRSGDSAIFEYIDGKLVIHHGRQYQIMTNSPIFEKQLALNEYWKNIGGTVFLPGTNRAADRFARASFLNNAIPKTTDNRYISAVPNQNFLNQALFSTLGIMRSVGVPLGITTPGEPNISSTLWRTVSDHKNLIYYYDSATSPNIFWVDLKKINFSKGAPVKKLDLLGGKIYSGNTSDSFIESQPFDFYPANK
jgi:penicillin V acylase-like amidase (Ntn superfamily)